MFYRLDAMLATKIFQAKEAMKNFVKNEDGDTNVLSVVIILVVVIGLAVTFRKNILQITTNMWNKILNDAGNFT